MLRESTLLPSAYFSDVSACQTGSSADEPPGPSLVTATVKSSLYITAVPTRLDKSWLVLSSVEETSLVKDGVLSRGSASSVLLNRPSLSRSTPVSNRNRKLVRRTAGS